MLLFCPNCSNTLTVSTFQPSSVDLPTITNTTISASGAQPNTLSEDASSDPDTPSLRLKCHTCPYQYLLDNRYYERKQFKRREREDVFGGPDKWKDAQKTKVQCPKDGCDGEEAAFFHVQIRSADEPMTGFFKCMTCGQSWRD